jgi:hypothetical protein
VSGWCSATQDYYGSGHQSAFDTPTTTLPLITSLTSAGAGSPTGVYTTVILVSSCIPFEDPDAGKGGSCQCSGYTENILEKTASDICDYTGYTATTTLTSARPR